MDSNLVIKVKYGDTLRRFNVFLHRNGPLDLDMDGLRAKILNLFKFAPDSDLTLTYIDEDNDMVTLVDNDDLCDAIRQRINPLRINVLLNSNGVGRVETKSSESSTPLKLPDIESSNSQYSNSSAADVSRSVPEPLRSALLKFSFDVASKAATAVPSLPEPLYEVISKLSQDLASKAGTLTPVLNELSENLSKLATSKVGRDSQGSDHSLVNTQNENHGNLNDDKVNYGATPTKHSVSVADVSSSDTKFVDPAIISTGNLIGGVGTSAPPGAVSDLSTGPHKDECGFSTLNYVIPQSSTSAKDKGKTIRMNLISYPNGNPIAISSPEFKSAFPYFQPSVQPVAPLSKPDSFGVSDVDNSKTNMPVAPFGLSPQNDSQVAGRGEEATQVVPSGLFLRRHHPHRNNYIHSNDSNMGRIFHKGVRCDGCGVHPITGPRFKSRVKVNYDLCSICFSEIGNEAEYTRMDHPRAYRSPRSLYIPFQGHRVRNSSILHGMPTRKPKIDSRFLQDVNIVDGTPIPPSTPFTKIWRMRNNGTIVWPRGTQLVWIGGDKLTEKISVDVKMPIEGCFSEMELDIAVDFVAPEHPGQYISYWRMALPSGQTFGQCIWVLIQVQVDATQNDALAESSNHINLNFPPEYTQRTGPLIDVNAVPIDCNHPDLNTELGIESVKPMDDGIPNSGIPNSAPESDTNANESNNVASTAEVITTLSHSLIDQPVQTPFIDAPVLPEDVDDGNVVEQTLLKELDEMGFKQIDLNKEILRRNAYDLEQSVEDLCGVSEWDPMLEELQEMGFCDKETNKKLLMKNGGSIKRVVMDLITGEKA